VAAGEEAPEFIFSAVPKNVEEEEEEEEEKEEGENGGSGKMCV
jgi:hypothetical protein